jgi:hypothetical protein
MAHAGAALVAKAVPPPLAHISSIRHLIDLKLERNPNYREADPNDAAAAPESRFHCPVRLLLPTLVCEH